jgi:hypothetical protein
MHELEKLGDVVQDLRIHINNGRHHIAQDTSTVLTAKNVMPLSSEVM